MPDEKIGACDMVQSKGEIADWDALGSFQPGPFKSVPYYDALNDCLTLYISDAESYRERIDRYLTVYRAIEDGKIVGCHVKYVKKLLEAVHAIRIGVKTETMTLGLLLLAVPLVEIDETDEIRVRTRKYREVLEPLSQVAGATKLPELATAGQC